MAGNQPAVLGNGPGKKCELKSRPATLLERGRILHRWQRKKDLARLKEAGRKTRTSLSAMFSCQCRIWIRIHQRASTDCSLKVWLGLCLYLRQKSGRWAEGKRQDPAALWQKGVLFQWPHCTFESNCFPGQSVPTGYLNAFSIVQYSEIKLNNFSWNLPPIKTSLLPWANV